MVNCENTTTRGRERRKERGRERECVCDCCNTSKAKQASERLILFDFTKVLFLGLHLILLYKNCGMGWDGLGWDGKVKVCIA